MTENEIAKIIVDAAYKVHVALGPGLLESVYEAVLTFELERRGIHVRRQQSIGIVYETLTIADAFRADLVVEGKVIVEIKSIELVQPVHKKQLLTYLRLSHMHLGLLMNFGSTLLRSGITRVVNGLDE
jgi:GxxExxY protein